MALAPVPTPEVLWCKPPVLAIAALPGMALGCLGEPSTASPAAWAAAGAAIRKLHDAPVPPWPGRGLDELAADLDGECEWLVTNGVLPADLVTRNRQVAEAALRPWTPRWRDTLVRREVDSACSLAPGSQVSPADQRRITGGVRASRLWFIYNIPPRP